ncbi:unnamed protein product [Symbiodinium sp. CCMP2592]|nr:unnamed protein product [Symbiodinium sp. CCMP2592]
MAAMALPSFASTQAQVKGKKEKSPKKVLLKTQQEAFNTDPADLQPAYLVRNGLEPIHEDEEHFTTIAPPPGLEKCDDDFSDSLWSRSTTGGSAGFETQPEEEVEDDFVHAALAEQIAKLSAMQIQETMATMYFNNLSTSPPAPMQAGEPAFAAAWTPTPVRNFCHLGLQMWLKVCVGSSRVQNLGPAWKIGSVDGSAKLF